MSVVCLNQRHWDKETVEENHERKMSIQYIECELAIVEAKLWTSLGSNFSCSCCCVFCVKKWKSLLSLLAPEFRPELFEFFVFELNIFQRDFGTGFFFVHVFFLRGAKQQKQNNSSFYSSYIHSTHYSFHNNESQIDQIPSHTSICRWKHGQR